MATAYPLAWPLGWPRTERPTTSRFQTSIPKAIANVETTLKRFASDSGKPITGIVISSNYTLGDRKPKDAGVAVYFTWAGVSTCYAVDRYVTVEDNLQAIHHCVEAERTKLRHGGLNVVIAAFRGYAALPPPGIQDDPWVVLGITPTTNVDAIKAAHRNLATTLHPDRGGDEGAMARINAARDRALAEARR